MKLRSFLRYLDVRWFRGLKIRPTLPLRRRLLPLHLEVLERRDVFSATRPTILAVTPTLNTVETTADPIIQVTYSQPMSGSATVASNYLLFDNSGNSYTVDSVTLTKPDSSGHETATVSYNEGNPLQAGTYTLLVRADLISDTVGLTISLPGQLAVVNSSSATSGRNGVAIVNVPENETLGTLSQYAVPASAGTAPAPTAVAMGNLTGTPGENDLVILSPATNQVDIYQGLADSGFSTAFANEPLVLNLPSSDSMASALLLGNFTGGVGPDIIVANAGTNTVTAFQNLSSAGTTVGSGVLSFASPQDFAAGTNPTSLAVGDFNNDGKLDLAIGNASVDTNGFYDVTLLPGTGDASIFGSASVSFHTGASTPGFQPLTLATGYFDNNTKPDLVLGGPNGVALWLNNQNGGSSFSFSSASPTLTGTAVTNVAAGVLRNTTTTPTLDDVAAVTSTGKLLIFQNLTLGSATPGSVSFSAPSTSTIGTAPLAGLAIAPLGINGTGQNDILITQNIGDATVGISGQLTVLLNDSTVGGNISFAAPVSYAVDGNPLGVAVGDTNSDGIPDVVTVNQSTNDFSLLQGTGTGTFYDAVNTALPATPVAVATADLNGDGIPDLIVATNPSHGNSSLTVFLGQISGGVVTYGSDSASFGLNISNIVSIAAGDLNGDGYPEIVALSESGADYDILLNNLVNKPLATGFTVESSKSLSTSGFGGTTIANPIQVILAPFTTASANSNIDDMLVAYEGSTGGGHGFGGGSKGGVALYTNTTSPLGTTTAPTFGNPNVIASYTANSSNNAVGAIAVGDFNNANYANGRSIEDFVVTYTPTSGSWDAAVYVNSGAGIFTNTTGPITLTGINNPYSIAVSDLNADGYQSIAIASQTAGTVAVLFNQGGTFSTPIDVSVPTGTGIQSITADFMDVTAPFPNLIVTTQSATASTMIDNVYTLEYDPGTGSYDNPLPYLAGGSSSPVLTPSTALILDDPILTVTTFMPKSSVVTVNLADNGNFSATGLTADNGGADTVGTLLGWQTYDLPNSPGGSNGGWSLQTGNTSPLSSTSVNPPSGNSAYQAMLDEANAVPYTGNNNPNASSTYQGSHALYQNITIPSTAQSVTLSMTLSLYNLSSDTTSTNPQGWSDNTTPQPLNYLTGTANQQVRVDIMDPNAPGFNILGITGATGLLGNIFLTTAGSSFTNPVNITVNSSGVVSVNGKATGSTVNLSAYAGETIMLRIAETNNDGQLLVGVSNVQLLAKFSVSTAPVVSNVSLRDAGYTVSSDSPLANGTLPVHTTDPTIVGQLSDAGGLNSPINKGNVAYVEFDLSNDSFSGAAGDVTATTSTWDPEGNFSYSIPTSDLLPGLNTIEVAAVDFEGNVSAIIPFTFYYQGPSLTNWQSYGPDNISVPSGSTVGGLNISYSTVSGSITAVANDPTDSSGNTYYVGSDNGGVWKTSDGGNDFTPLTNNVTDSKGNPIPVPVGAIAVSQTVAHATDTHVVYVGTGVAGLTGNAQTGFGVLVSTDGGRTWSIDGNSGTVLAGATITAMVVDNDNPGIVYVAVASGGQNGPGVYKTTNALGNSSLSVNTSSAVWTFITSDSVMFTSSSGSTLATGTQLQSITSLVEDPSNDKRLIIGIGDIGLNSGASAKTTGVWLSSDQGGSWYLQQGGLNGVPNSTLPSGVAGNTLGKVLVAIAGGNVGAEPNVYVLIGTPPTSNTAPNFSYGSEYSGANGSGLYFSPNNMLDFTDVMLKVNLGGSDTINPANFQSINLFGDNAANAGALIVDPTDPDVVYVGGSLRNVSLGDPSIADGIDQFFIRVDVGNIDGINGNGIYGDNTGDDSSKEAKAGSQGNFYYDFDPTTGVDTVDAYKGEGVYWYNLGEDAVSQGGNVALLPPDIQALAFDSQGRLLIGTDSGLYRGVNLGYSYDFTSGGTGILTQHKKGSGTGEPTPPGMAIASLNANLQITDLTSVAIDPSTRGQLYTTAYNIGSAQSDSLLSWSSNGLDGPTVVSSGTATNLGIITAGSVIASQPASGSSAGASTTLYRVWEYANDLAVDPEQSVDSGQTWSAINTTGIPENVPAGTNPAGTFPAFVVNPIPIFNSGLEQSQLLFGTNRVFISNTSGTVFDQFSPILSTKGGLLTALAYAPTNTGISTDVFFAGDNLGEVFASTNDGATWSQVGGTTLPTSAQVSAITVDNANAQVAYVMFGYSSTTIGHIWRTNNDGTTWTNVTNNLPTSVNSANSMVIVTNPTTGVETIYLATNVGVFESTNAGSSWKSVGNGLPNVAVVDLQYNATFGVLAAATLGRGVFTLSTQTTGPYVTDVTNGSASSDTATLTSLNVTFSEPINRATVNSTDVTITGPGGASDTLAFTATDIDSVNSEIFQLTFNTPQAANGFYTVSIGTGVQDQLGNSLTQTQDGISSSNSFSGRIYFETGTNSAPVLHSTAIAFSPAVNEDGNSITGVTSNQGVDLATWIAAQSPTLITDADSGAVQGIAITSIDDSNGTWQYSQNSGTTWNNIPTTVAETNALLLQVDSTNRIRFVPNTATYEKITPPPSGILGGASFTFRAWDLTSGLTEPEGTDGSFADASINGGATAFSSQETTATIQVYFDNHAPTFTVAGTSKGDQIINESTANPPAYQTVTKWATGLSAGPTNEASQTLNFVVVSNSNPSLFLSEPMVTVAGSASAGFTGTLGYQVAQYASGTATIVVELQDNGGTANGGTNTSSADTFTITVNYVNQPPTFTVTGTQNGNQTIYESGAVSPPVQTVTNWADSITVGPGNPLSDTLTFNESNSNPSLFLQQPAISANGTLTYEPAQYANGSALVTVDLQNSGNDNNGGQNTSAPVSFTITILPVNQAPTFTPGANQSLAQNGSPTLQTIAPWATNVAAGPANEASQSVSFTVTNNNPSLFSVQPSIAANGNLTYEIEPFAIGSATVSATLQDNGGTANGGQNTSATDMFTITVIAVNQPPTFTGGPNQLVTDDNGPNAASYTVPNWATNISPGPADQAGETVNFIVTNSNNGLFSVQPAISPNGTLTYTVAPNANGSASVKVLLQNSGGTANGGQDTSTPATFNINVYPINQPPSFTPAGNETATVYDGVHTIPSWATNLTAGSPAESWQTLTFNVSNSNPSLFLVQPTISSNGTLTYQPSATVGAATVTVTVLDNGGTLNGGQNTSAVYQFTITINPVGASASGSLSANEAWISQLYLDLLGRQIRPDEMPYWNNQLNNGATRLQVATGIANSDGHHMAYVQSLFQSYLGIQADQNALNFYVGTMYDQDGATDQQVQATILSSAAYYQKNGGTNAGFVTALYENVYGQTPATLDQGGIASWEAQLAAGMSRYNVALAIVNAPNGQAATINAGYELLLKRPSDAIPYWQNQFAQGMTNEGFLAALAASPEYGLDSTATNYNSQPDLNWLNQVFLDSLGRPIDQVGSSYYINKIRAGVQRTDIVAEILNSSEYRNDIVAAAFQSILHRPADAGTVAYFVNYLNQGYSLEQVKAVMFASPEYYYIQGGGTQTGYLTALYRDALNAPLDAAGLADWGTQLAVQAVTNPNIISDPGANPVLESVALSVLTSQGGYQNLIYAGYQKFLRRTAVGDSGTVFWMNQFLAGTITDTQFYGSLMASNEYYNDFSN